MKLFWNKHFIVCMLAFQAWTIITPAFAQDAQAFDAQFQAKQAATRTFSAGFRQSLQIAGMTKPTEGRGRIYFQAPDRMKLEFTQPAGEFLVVNGSTMAVQKSGQPLRVRPLNANSGGTGMLLDFFTQGPLFWEKEYVRSMEKKGSRWQVVLTARAPNPRQPHRIATLLNAQTAEIESMQIEFSKEDRLRYEFFGVQRNQPLRVWLFDIPKTPSVAPSPILPQKR